MAPINPFHLLFATFISLLHLPVLLAQTTSPASNASLTANASPNLFIMDTIVNNMATHINLYPLTNDAGLVGSPNQLLAINPSGPMFLANADTVNSLQAGNIAYISCDQGDYSGQIDAAKCLGLAVGNKPNAIVLYSMTTPGCSFQPTGGFDFTMLYTMTDANSSSAVAGSLENGNPQSPMAKIHVDSSAVNGTSNSDQNVLGKSPTTAVAMIILYSITGIITALFLIIIVVGAIRAHRHPERYGPRHIRGRPRQSRAKGIARAMLETLPIVKFGDNEEEKPTQPARDIELAPTDAENSQASAAQAGEASKDSHAPTAQAPDEAKPEETVAEPSSGSPEPREEGAEADKAAADSGLACSVCTDDFVKGQDLRVLPCNHKFHPECIDPWLLNVSGTCPLCRVDLQPHDVNATTDPDAAGPASENVSGDGTSPADDGVNGETDASHRNRRSRILSTLNIGRMRHATPDERIEALRRVRDERLATESDAGDMSTGRFSRRISRAFGSRPTSVALGSRPVSDLSGLASETGPFDARRHGSFAGPTR